MAMFQSELSKAEAESQRLFAARETLETKAQAAIEELDRLQAESGERELAEVLDGTDGSAGRARILTLTNQIDGMVSARRLLVSQLSATMQAVNRAEAADLRAKADKLETEIRRHVAERDKRLQALQQHEEALWTPLINAEQAQAAALSQGSLSMGGNFQGTVPKSDRMTAELIHIRQQADAIERRKVRIDGEAEGDSLEQLLGNLNMPGCIAPIEAEVRRWAAAGEAKAIEALRKSLRGPEPVWVLHYRLTWRGGLIVEAASHVRLIVVDPEAVQSIAEARQRQLARAAA